jgi:hypothetical protein
VEAAEVVMCLVRGCSKPRAAGSTVCEWHATPADDPVAFIKSIASQYRDKQRSLTFDELVAAGFEGLKKAKARWNPARGVKLLTYAHTDIRGSMIAAVNAAQKLASQEVSVNPQFALDHLEIRHQRSDTSTHTRAKKPTLGDRERPQNQGKNLDRNLRFRDPTRDFAREPPADPGRSPDLRPAAGTPCRVPGCEHMVATGRNICALHLSEMKRKNDR